MTLLPAGRFRLRDFDEPVELFNVMGDGRVSSTAALRALPADGHNLVRPRTRLIGREVDVEGIAELAGSGRLVSIVGPAGSARPASSPSWDCGWPTNGPTACGSSTCR